MNPRRPAPARPTLALLAIALAPGCATIGPGRSLVPTRHETKAGPYVVYTNAPLPADAPALKQLRGLGRQLEATLGVRVDPRTPAAEVYILDDREAFARFLTFHHPEFPPRRAFFLAQDGRRQVYTHMGDRLEEDLRHEATHALLNAAIGDVPLWLDEGLAEYFEVPEDRGGLNAEHLARLPRDQAAGWSPDLRRLEALADVRQMTPRDYRESWAWVHYLLAGPSSGRSALLAYLADLRDHPDAEPLSARLPKSGDRMGARLLAHLGRVRESALADSGATPARASTARFQDEPAETPEREPRHRGFFGKIGRWLGL